MKTLMLIAIVTLASSIAWADSPSTKVILTDAPLIRFPGVKYRNRVYHADCNSPVHWDGDTLHVFNSWNHPNRSSGPSLDKLGGSSPVTIDTEMTGGRWLESTWVGPKGRLYGWYHNEPDDWTKPGKLFTRYPTIARVGAMVSEDHGASWRDLGLVITPPDNSENRKTKMAFYVGGIGDFCACVDQQNQFIYFFLTSFHADIRHQGLVMGRMAVTDKDEPAGKVNLWDGKEWKQPGLKGAAKPFLSVTTDWHGAHPDGFWGPIVHWNRNLDTYVMFMNRVKSPTWNSDGVYVSYNAEISNPSGWSTPVKVLDGKDATTADLQAKKPGHGWYVTVIGTAPGDTDTTIGSRARLFVDGMSRWEVSFKKD